MPMEQQELFEVEPKKVLPASILVDMIALIKATPDIEGIHLTYNGETVLFKLYEDFDNYHFECTRMNIIPLLNSKEYDVVMQSKLTVDSNDVLYSIEISIENIVLFTTVISIKNE